MRSSGEDILHMPIHPLQHCEIQLLGAILIQLWQGLTRLLLLCCHSSTFPENKSSNFSPTPLNIQNPKKKKKTHPQTQPHSLTHSLTRSLNHTTKQSPTSLPFPFLSFPFPFQQREETEPLGSLVHPQTPKPFQIANAKNYTILQSTLLPHKKRVEEERRNKKMKRRHTHCFERVQGHK
jgi:hypothetical protein